MTICDDSSHDEIVYDEQKRVGGMLSTCPLCKALLEIKDLEDALKAEKDRE